MTSELAPLGPTLLKDLIPVAGITSVLLIARRSGLSLRDDVGVKPAPAAESVMWVVVIVAWMLGTNYFFHWRGPWDFTVWRNAPLSVAAARVFGVAVLAPISEELIFRGLFFWYFSRTKLGVALTIVLLTAVWVAVHTTFLPGAIPIVFVAGLLFGTARWRTKSVYVPIAMHLIWNFYSIW